MSYTARQNDLLHHFSKELGFTTNDIVSTEIDTNIPTHITYDSNTGRFTRSTFDLHGKYLTTEEKNALKLSRAATNSGQLDSLNDIAALLGQSRNPSITDFTYTATTTASNLANATRFDPSAARLAAAGLTAGAQATSAGTVSVTPKVKFNDEARDYRVKITDPSGYFISAANPVLSPLADVGYVLFPYTPDITVSHTANYSDEALTHSNYSYAFYQNSVVNSISITAQFSCKNAAEAAYVIAVQHFFRSVTKMFYGKDAEAGLPPPVLRLDGHGDYQFSSVPIVIKSFSTSLPTDVDYITTGFDSTNTTTAGPGNLPVMSSSLSTATKVPVLQTFSIECQPVYSRRSISQDFGLKEFAAGKLLATTTGRGGFI